MKITDIKCYMVPFNKENPRYGWRKDCEYGDGMQPGKKTFTAYVKVETDEGIDGFTQCWDRADILSDVIRRRYRRFIGRDPLMTEQIWQDLWQLDRAERLQVDMPSYLDLALWDIKSQAADLPVYKMIGGNSSKVRAYASTVTWETPDEYERHIKTCMDVGFTAFKLHGYGVLKDDIRLARSLRKWAGDDAILMFDASAAFCLEEALTLGRELEYCGYYWLEEPMREFNVPGYIRLCEQLTIPVLGAETNEGAHWAAATWISTGACDMIRTSSKRTGGITGAVKVAHLAESFGMKAQVLHERGCVDLPLCAGLSNNDFFEQIITDAEQIKTLHLNGEKRVVDGYVTAPERPGVDIHPDWNLIEKSAQYVVSAKDQNW